MARSFCVRFFYGRRRIARASRMSLVALLLGGHASADTVPAAYLGRWARDGRCADPAALLVITPQTATLGRAAPAAIVYVPDDDGAGHGALHWRQEGVVDDFVFDQGSQTLVHHLQGSHMPGRLVYRRCS